MKQDHLSKEELRRLLLEVLEELADDLGLPKAPAPSEPADREAADETREVN